MSYKKDVTDITECNRVLVTLSNQEMVCVLPSLESKCNRVTIKEEEKEEKDEIVKASFHHTWQAVWSHSTNLYAKIRKFTVSAF